MELNKIRAAIDSIDADIIRLLSRRIEFAVRTRRFKDSVVDPSRERDILERIKAKSKALITPQFSEAIFSTIIAESQRLQSLGMKLVGFHGEHGSAAEYVLGHYQKEWVPIPCSSTIEIFEGIKSGALDCGIVPIENSSGRSTSTAFETLVASDLFIAAELISPVHYSLLSLPETDYQDIKVVYSTVESLIHCKDFLSRHHLEGRPYYDAAGAAQMLIRDKPSAAAVIAHGLCADVYGLQVLKENIEDHAHNKVRYIVVSREQNTHGAKCTISFTTKHQAGSLMKILHLFAERGINLTRIESCINPNDASLVTFLVDFEGSEETSQVQQALEEMKTYTVNMKFFGSYSSVQISDAQ